MAFQRYVSNHHQQLKATLHHLCEEGARVAAYGASTKGSVLLQAAGLTHTEIAYAADANPRKVGRYLPGTGIPIISEEDMRQRRPDYLLVLPWAFAFEFSLRELALLEQGTQMIVPFPYPHIFARTSVGKEPAYAL